MYADAFLWIEKKLDFDKYFFQVSIFIDFDFKDSISYQVVPLQKRLQFWNCLHTLDLDERLSQFGILILDLESCRLQLLKDGELGRENIISICNISIWQVDS